MLVCALREGRCQPGLRTRVKGLGQGAGAREGDPAPGGAQAQDAAEAGGHPDAAAGVAAHGKVDRSVSDRHLCSTRDTLCTVAWYVPLPMQSPQ